MSKSLAINIINELPEKEQLALSVLSVPSFLTNSLAEDILIKTETTNGDTHEVLGNLLSYPIWIRKSKNTWMIDKDVRNIALKKLNGSTQRIREKVLETYNTNKESISTFLLTEQKDFDFQLARLGLSLENEQKQAIHIFRSYFDIAEKYRNTYTSKIVSAYIDENIKLNEKAEVLPAHILSAYYMRGLQAYKINDYDNALKFLIPVYNKKEQNADSNHDAAIALHIIGTIWAKRKKYELAEKAFRDSLDLEEINNNQFNIAHVYHSLGNLCKDTNRFNEAENLFIESIKLRKPVNDIYGLAQVYHSLGNLLSKDNKRLKEAEEAYMESLRIDELNNNMPGLAKVYHSLGNLLSKIKSRSQEAEEYFKESLRLERKSHKQNGLAQIYHSLGNFLSKNKNRQKEAEKAYKESLKIAAKINKTSTTAQVLYSLGNLLSKDKNRYKEAEKAYQESLKLELSKNNEYGLSLVYFAYGELMFKQKDYMKAKELFNQAIMYEKRDQNQQKILFYLKQIKF